MKKSNGYTTLDIIIIVVLLSISALILIPRISLAFNDEREDIYQEQTTLYLKQAKKYGEDNVEKLKENENSIVMSVEELIEAKYIGSDIFDDGNNVKNLKIQITYNEEDDTIKVEYI